MIRRVNNKDADKITVLERLIFQEQVKPDPCEESIKKYCNSSHGWVYDDNEIKGYLLFCLKKNSAYIVTIGVHPEYRGKGLATKLIHTCLNSINVPIYLHVQINNITALNLYLKLGFQIISTTIERFDDKDAYLCKYNIT